MNQYNEIDKRLEYLESEMTDRDEFYALEARVDKLENEVTYRDIYIYISVFCIIISVSKQLNNMI